MPSIIKKILQYDWASNVLKALGFGMLGALFISIEFRVSSLEDGYSNFSEIVFLISVLFLNRPAYLVVSVSLAVLLSSIAPSFHVSGILGHLGGLLPVWFCYHRYLAKRTNTSTVQDFVYSFFSVMVYYLIFLLPFSAIRARLADPDVSLPSKYLNLIAAFKVEIIATTFCVVLFFMLFMSYRKLVNHIKALELRNKQLEEYAFINSHVLRAPVAKILGLSALIEPEDSTTDPEVLVNLKESCEELDHVVRSINKSLAQDESNSISKEFASKAHIKV